MSGEIYSEATDFLGLFNACMNEPVLGGRYKVIKDLASGGMGQTFIAEDTQLPGNPTCVVKQLKPATADAGFLATAKRLFFSEAETLQTLGTHNQIPRLLAYFEEDSEFYLVQDYVEGHPLSAEIVLGQRWHEPQVIQLLQDILEVLSFVHSQNVIHRDIKPGNIIRRAQDSKLVLIDFGAVKQIQSQQTHMPGTVAIGTQGYMPAEQLSGSPRLSSDLYAIGIIAIQALTGLLPTQLHKNSEGDIVWKDQANVSAGLAAFLSKMVRDYHKQRYQTSNEALQALQQLSHSSSHNALPPTITPYTDSTGENGLKTKAQQQTAKTQSPLATETAQPSASALPQPPSIADESAVSVPNSPQTSATVVVSPAAQPASSNNQTGNISAPTTPRNKTPLLIGSLLSVAIISGALSFAYFNNKQPPLPPGDNRTDETDLGAGTSPTDKTDPPDQTDLDNPFAAEDFPQATCGDTNVTKPFYRVYAADPQESIVRNIQRNHCKDAYLETKTARLKIASFDTERRAEYFKMYLGNSFGPIEIEEVVD